jgi:FixJ family two-component response regulator
MAEQGPIVYIVDDDAGVRNAMDSLIRSVGLKARTFVSADEFLRAKLPSAPGCLILDVRMPGRSGLDLQNELLKVDNPIPIIFISGHGDVPMAVRVMKAGAVEFLIKPFRDQELLDAIQQAIARDRVRRSEHSEVILLRERYSALTPREREVMRFVIAGLLNKQIGAKLGTSETTIKLQRGQVMHKMLAESVPGLVRMAAKLGLPS